MCACCCQWTLVIADAFSEEANTRTVAAGEIPDGWQGLDIGEATRELFAQEIRNAATVVWKRPWASLR